MHRKIVMTEGVDNVWITSDTHFGHSNICRATSSWPDLSTRDFESLDQMNETILENINRVVGENDLLIHLGDVAFGGFDNLQYFWDNVVCKRRWWIGGNHDHHGTNNKNNILDQVELYTQYMTVDLRIQGKGRGRTEKRKLVLCHFPITSWDSVGKGTIHLHGHLHKKSHEKFCGGKSMDVGMDGNNMEVYNLLDCVNMTKHREIDVISLPQDRHIRIKT